MAVTRQDVLHVARLARLELSTAEIERFTDQLNGILVHVEELAEAGAARADTGLSAGSAAHAGSDGGSSAAPLRVDVPGSDPLRRAPAEIAASWADGFFTVPRLPALDAEATVPEP